ncbi:MAG: hypothetical protein ABSF98_11325 [Bryobacteraceae bacterium]
MSRPSRRQLPTAGHDAILSPTGWAPLAMVLAAVLVLAACVGTMGFALLRVLSPAFTQETLRHAPPPAVRPEPDPRAEMMARQRELASLDKELRDARQRIQVLEREVQPGPQHILVLNRQQDELTRLIEQRRASLRDYEEAARRQAAQQEAARQRIERLRAEAAELERRIAALKASVGQAQEARSARAAAETRSPQLVECVRGAVVLQPQHTRIPVAALRGGAFVSAVRGRGGVNFLVRPDGLDSFLAARAIARAAGVTTLGYEPVLSGSHP